MYVCMYVRMYVCMYVCMYVRTYVCISHCNVQIAPEFISGICKRLFEGRSNQPAAANSGPARPSTVSICVPSSDVIIMSSF